MSKKSSNFGKTSELNPTNSSILHDKKPSGQFAMASIFASSRINRFTSQCTDTIPGTNNNKDSDSVSGTSKDADDLTESEASSQDEIGEIYDSKEVDSVVDYTNKY